MRTTRCPPVSTLARRRRRWGSRHKGSTFCRCIHRRTIEALGDAGVTTHLVMPRSAQLTLGLELSLKTADVQALADVNHRHDDIGASISSGSFRTIGMVVAPCSIRSLSEIATGVTSGLLTRAADVSLKERRRPVLMVRDTQ